MLGKQQEMTLSAYPELYDLLVPKDNELRCLHDMVDFDFVYEELTNKYHLTKGRPAESPVRMFKYLLLKVISQLSDADVVKHSLYDLSFKYFLDLAPEETGLINPSSLTKFRRLRLKDVDMLHLLIGKSLEIAKSKGISIKGRIIMDATHTLSRAIAYNAEDIIRTRGGKLHEALEEIYKEDCSKIPSLTGEGGQSQLLDAASSLLSFVESGGDLLFQYPSVSEAYNFLKEGVDDINEQNRYSKDREARTGYKSPQKPFFGYKTHIGLDSDTRLITAATVTPGNKNDGTQLPELVEQSKGNGVPLECVIADRAYASGTNIQACAQEKVPLYATMHSVLSNGSRRKEDGFSFNKDAGMMVCPAGHLATGVYHCVRAYGKHNKIVQYYFDVEKCKDCPLRDGCYKPGAKSKTYNVTILDELHQSQMDLQGTEDFKTASKERYKIEAKNAELKHSYGFVRAKSYGLQNMQLQSAVGIFACNLARILKLVK